MVKGAYKIGVVMSKVYISELYSFLETQGDYFVSWREESDTDLSERN